MGTGNIALAYHFSCACGAVECVGIGAPVGTAVCYCDDCLAAARAIEALPGAPPVADPDGGTALSLFLKERFEIRRGADQLVPHKLRSESRTSRMIASCCNSAMFLAFEDNRFWHSTMINRIAGEKPPIEYRIMTKFRTSSLPFPDGAPTYRGTPIGFVLRVAWAGLKRLMRK